MTELDLLEGIPGQYIDEYIRQHMLRADQVGNAEGCYISGIVLTCYSRPMQDKDGQLCCQEFIIWFFTEIAALLPFKCNVGAGNKPKGQIQVGMVMF